MRRRNRALNLLWQIPLACFILAGLTGFMYRLGLIGVSLFDLNLQNIRHAHSHLMFFCWAVPLPMYFIIKKVNREIAETGPPILMTRMALAGLILGLLSYPFFLSYGYLPVAVGGLGLPVSVMLSGLVMLCWYGFIAGYWKERKYIDSDLSMQFFDGALFMLFLCSLGAWGVAVVQFSGIENPLLGKALTHFFLATFTEGWVVMVLLGVIYQHLDLSLLNVAIPEWLLSGVILLGAPLTFPYGIATGLMSEHLMLAARIGGGIAATGLAVNLYVISRNMQSRLRWAEIIIGALLIVKVIGQLLASVLPSGFWLSNHGLRILYLHVLLLGCFSFTLFFMLAVKFKVVEGLKAVAVSIIAVLLSLILLTPLWPSAWFSFSVFYTIALISVLPSLATAGLWYALTKFRFD